MFFFGNWGRLDALGMFFDGINGIMEKLTGLKAGMGRWWAKAER